MNEIDEKDSVKVDIPAAMVLLVCRLLCWLLCWSFIGTTKPVYHDKQSEVGPEAGLLKMTTAMNDQILNYHIFHYLFYSLNSADVV